MIEVAITARAECGCRLSVSGVEQLPPDDHQLAWRWLWMAAATGLDAPASTTD